MLIAQLLLQVTLMTAVFAALLFWPAGTLHWREAWVFLVGFIGGSLALSLWLARRDPDLLRERLDGPVRKGQAGWDRIFLASPAGSRSWAWSTGSAAPAPSPSGSRL